MNNSHYQSAPKRTMSVNRYVLIYFLQKTAERFQHYHFANFGRTSHFMHALKALDILARIDAESIRRMPTILKIMFLKYMPRKEFRQSYKILIQRPKIFRKSAPRRTELDYTIEYKWLPHPGKMQNKAHNASKVAFVSSTTIFANFIRLYDRVSDDSKQVILSLFNDQDSQWRWGLLDEREAFQTIRKTILGCRYKIDHNSIHQGEPYEVLLRSTFLFQIIHNAMGTSVEAFTVSGRDMKRLPGVCKSFIARHAKINTRRRHVLEELEVRLLRFILKDFCWLDLGQMRENLYVKAFIIINLRNSCWEGLGICFKQYFRNYKPRLILSLVAASGDVQMLDYLLQHLPHQQYGLRDGFHRTEGFAKMDVFRSQESSTLRVMRNPFSAALRAGEFHMAWFLLNSFRLDLTLKDLPLLWNSAVIDNLHPSNEDSRLFLQQLREFMTCTKIFIRKGTS